jgi:hypothetical protein
MEASEHDQICGLDRLSLGFGDFPIKQSARIVVVEGAFALVVEPNA